MLQVVTDIVSFGETLRWNVNWVHVHFFGVDDKCPRAFSHRNSLHSIKCSTRNLPWRIWVSQIAQLSFFHPNVLLSCWRISLLIFEDNNVLIEIIKKQKSCHDKSLYPEIIVWDWIDCEITWNEILVLEVNMLTFVHRCSSSSHILTLAYRNWKQKW